MLQLAVFLLVIALLAGLLGFGGLAGSFVGLAIVFFVSLILAVLSFAFRGQFRPKTVLLAIAGGVSGQVSHARIDEIYKEQGL